MEPAVWIPRAPMKGFWWHLHVGSSLDSISLLSFLFSLFYCLYRSRILLLFVEPQLDSYAFSLSFVFSRRQIFFCNFIFRSLSFYLLAFWILYLLCLSFSLFILSLFHNSCSFFGRLFSFCLVLNSLSISYFSGRPNIYQPNSYTNQHKRSDVYDPENNSIIFGILLTFIFRKSHLKSWMKITNKNREVMSTKF